MDRHGQTQPSRPQAAAGQSGHAPIDKRKSARRGSPRRIKSLLGWMWVMVGILLLVFATVTGGLAGHQAGTRARQERETGERLLALSEQFQLGLLDMQAGRYEVAMQRFEYVLNQDPSFPGVTEKLAEAVQILYATATRTPLPPTPTPTPPEPTPDLRPLQETFAQAQAALSAGDWTTAIETLISLRGKDPAFQTAQVDGMLFLALRQRGIDKILNGRDLQGGSYDLSLAERFGPLDSRAEAVRGWARLYMYGSGFWEADPARAVYYFGQVAAAAPYLTDASGWTAMERYRAALIQYGDALARQENWCEALAQYDLALSIRGDSVVQATEAYSFEQCFPPTATPTPETPTPTPTVTFTLIAPDTPTVAPPTEPPASPTPTPETSPTPTLETPPTVPPSETPTLELTPTPTPTPSETPSAAPGETATPTLSPP